jgi:putative SOS response-associated peptidase YedK
MGRAAGRSWPAARHECCPDGSAVRTFAPLTAGVNAAVRPVHDRTPVLPDSGDLGRWPDTAVAPADLLALLRPPPTMP